MKSFLTKAIIAFLILSAILICGLLISSPLYEDTLLGVLPQKHLMLKEKSSPKIIFIGGSSASFGQNSEPISKAFGMPVVNMGIHAGIGLKFMMEDIKPYVNKNDVVVLAPEYENYYSSVYYGDNRLAYILFDIYPNELKLLSLKQWGYFSPHAIKYAGSKLLRFPRIFIDGFIKKAPSVKDEYRLSSFNEYGDAHIHWDKEGPKHIEPEHPVKDATIDQDVLVDISEFKKEMESKGAKVLLLPPPLQKISYENLYPVIEKLQTDSIVHRLNPRFDAARYSFADSLMFDTPYHLNKKGVDLRTEYLIEDLRASGFFN